MPIKCLLATPRCHTHSLTCEDMSLSCVVVRVREMTFILLSGFQQVELRG